MKRQNFLMLAAAALLASCSQDDALQSTVLNNEGLKPKHSTQQRGSEADDHHRLPAHRRDADTRRRR